MAGLMTQEAPDRQSATIAPGRDATAMGPPDTGADDTPNVSPEEQAMYDKFVDNGLSLIFDEKAAPQLLNRIKSAPNPVEGLAATTVMVVSRLRDSAENSGQQIEPAVLLHGGAELMENIAMLAKASGVHEYSESEMEQATYAAMDQYGDQAVKSGKVDKQAVAQDFQEMMAADKAGQIDQLLPGLGKGRG